MGKHPELKPSVAKLLKKQEGKCEICNLTFQPEDNIETDHIIPQKAGVHKYKDNLQIVHKHCHDVKTKEDLKLIKRYKSEKSYEKILKWFNQLNWVWINDIPTLVKNGTHNKSLFGEEPCEAKVSRTVLKTSRTGNSLA